MRKIILILGVIAILTLNSNSQTVTDIDGNIYQTVQIGNQVWMKENLKTIRYRNGDSVSNKWGFDTFGAYNFYNKDVNNTAIYGRLYNWYAVKDSRNLCPSGWHVPNITEWQTLSNFLGGDTLAGGKIKETGTIHWINPNTGATNQSGFTALPGGSASPSGSFYTLGKNGSWYCTTESNTNNAWSIYLFNNDSILYYGAYSKYNGISVRCLKDSANSINDNNSKFDFQIYPNPAKDKISVFYKNIQNPTLSIYNLEGKLILEKRLISNKSIINVDSLSQGLYIIKISNEKGSYQQNLVIE